MTLYYVIYPAAETAPTDVQIVSGLSWTPAVDAGSEAVRGTTGDQTFAEVTGLTAGNYRVAFVVYDGVDYSNVSVSDSIAISDALEVAASSSGSESSAVEVQQEHGLTVTSASSGSESSPVELTQVHTLEAAAASSGSEASAVEVQQEHSLTVAAASSGSEAPAVEAEQESGLAVAEASSGSEAPPVSLTQTHTLEVAGSSSGSDAPSVELINEDELAVSPASSGSESSPVALGQIHTLEVEPASSGSDAPAIELFGDGNLEVAGSSSGSSVPAVEVAGPVAEGGGGGKPRSQRDTRTLPYERKGLEQLKESARRARLISVAREEDEHLIQAMKQLLMEAA